MAPRSVATVGVVLAGMSLLLCAPTLDAQEGKPLFSEAFSAEEFASRRAALAAAIGPGSMALIQGASGAHSSTRFRQSNQFFYLTGVEAPNAYLLIQGGGGHSTLYLPPRNESRERTDGAVLSADDPEGVARLTGMDAVALVDRLSEDLGRRTPSGTRVYTLFQPAEGPSESRAGVLRAEADRFTDPWDGRVGREGHFIHLIRTRFPFIEVHDLSPMLDVLRLIKSDAELAQIERATRLGGEALMEAMRSTRPGIRERELDAVARFIFVRHGAQGEAYRAIVASGRNAWFAHHRAGNKEMRADELVLMDFCPDLGYYRCDVTRMWPVDGSFSAVQRELYGFYLAFYNSILAEMRPGISAQQVKLNALPAIDAALAATRFSKDTYERAARDFVEDFRVGAQNPNTGLGHGVGLSTHDPGRSEGGILRPGMVFVIEPQFRVPEEEIYIRLEDMIVIREHGAEVISDWVPRDIAGIEALMREEGLLQRHPGLQGWQR